MLKSGSRLAVVLVVSAIVLYAHPLPAAPRLGIEVSDPEHKVVGGPDEDGDLEVSVKVVVKNPSERDLHVEVVVRALDRESFAVFVCYMSAVIKSGHTQALSEVDYIPEGRYKSIVSWQIKQVTVTGEQPNNAVQPATGAPR